MLLLIKEPIQPDTYLNNLESNIGACLFFAGVVRNAIEDNHVEGIEYTAYEKLCFIKEKCFELEFKVKYPDKSYKIIHRLGYVPFKETSLLVQLSSPHRLNSFSALEYIVEWIKSDLPVWKKIIHTDGARFWKANNAG